MPEFNSIKNAKNVLQNTKSSWLFHVVALQWTAKKRKENFNTRTQSLFCSFRVVVVTVRMVVVIMLIMMTMTLKLAITISY